MKRSVRLSLKKETLTTLSGDDLSSVAGGVPNHTLEIPCFIAISPSVTAPTQCCHGIPTFHRDAC